MRHAMADHPTTGRNQMSQARHLPVLLLAILALNVQADDPALGRLFLTPQQRAKLDQQRLRNPEQLPDPAGSEASQTFNGEVRSSNGRHTRWINGEADWNGTAAPPRVPVGDTY